MDVKLEAYLLVIILVTIDQRSDAIGLSIPKNELPKLTARFWKIHFSNSGTRGCPSRVTLNLTVYKAYTKKNQSSCIFMMYISQHFSMLFLLSEGNF